MNDVAAAKYTDIDVLGSYMAVDNTGNDDLWTLGSAL